MSKKPPGKVYAIIEKGARYFIWTRVVSIALFVISNCLFSYKGVYLVVLKLSIIDVVFSVDLVFKEELNLLLEISDF